MLQSAVLLLGQPWDPFSKAQHEARMNAWLIDYVNHDNQRKLQVFMHGWSDYKVNAQRYAELGMEVPAWDRPAPKLDDLGPMPDGYWFGKQA